jgi:hypothetical protein
MLKFNIYKLLFQLYCVSGDGINYPTITAAITTTTTTTTVAAAVTATTTAATFV